MPIYEYACKKCDGEFEVSQRITDEPLKRHLCPHCGKKTVVTKLISRSSFHLKGSGWYMTDYGKNGSKSSDSDDAKSGESKSESKGESSESKGETKSSESKGETKSSESKGETKSSESKSETKSSSSSSKSESSSQSASSSAS